MSQTKFVFEGFAPFTNDSRLSEFARAIAAVFEAHRVTGFFVNQTGPYPDGWTDKDFHNGPTSRPVPAAAPGGARDDQRSERARLAAEDFGGPEGDPDPEPGPGLVTGPTLGDRGDGQPADGEPGRKRRQRSDAGKPRGPRGAAASGSAAEGRRDDQRPEGRDASGRDGDGPAPRGGREGQRPGEGADGRSGRGVGRPGAADVRDAEAPAVSAADEDWSSADDWSRPEPAVDPADYRTGEDDGVNGEEWCAKSPGEWPDSLTPENVDRTVLSGIMSDHYRAHGGKFRAVTFDLLFKACQAADIASVPEKDLRRVAKVFLKDTARYKFGLQPQPTKAPPQ